MAGGGFDKTKFDYYDYFNSRTDNKMNQLNVFHYVSVFNNHLFVLIFDYTMYMQKYEFECPKDIYSIYFS